MYNFTPAKNMTWYIHRQMNRKIQTESLQDTEKLKLSYIATGYVHIIKLYIDIYNFYL